MFSSRQRDSTNTNTGEYLVQVALNLLKVAWNSTRNTNMAYVERNELYSQECYQGCSYLVFRLQKISFLMKK